MEKLLLEYQVLLASQHFDADELDYNILEQHKLMLQQLARVGNSGITVFDMNRREHVFTSYNFGELLGHNLGEIERLGSAYFDSRIHPDDFMTLTVNGIELLKYFYNLPVDVRRDFKLVNEYRILNADNVYVRVVEQHQVLELDQRGNVWLSIAIIDISPNQDVTMGVNSQLINFKTGKIFPFLPEKASVTDDTKLTVREKEVLQLVKEGYLSKEISDKLAISVHTVNTHRQRILEKLGVDNSMEAIAFAGRLGLVK